MARTTAIHDKVSAATLGAAVSQVAIWLIERVNTIGDIPFAVESAITIIFVFGAGYFVRESKPPTSR